MIGVSYSCRPDVDPATFAQFCADCGVGMTDIRPGNGQGWEAVDGDPFARLRLDVVSLNAPIVLGRGTDKALAGLDRITAARRISHRFLRVFLEAEATEDAVARDLRVLSDVGYAPSRVAVETHNGYADAAQIDNMCARFGSTIILDTLGLWHIAKGVFNDSARMVTSRAAIAHVKGFDPQSGGRTPHIPLRDEPQGWTSQILDLLPPRCPMIVETKASDLVGDINFLKCWKEQVT